MAHHKWPFEPHIGHFHYHMDKYVTTRPIIKQSGTFYARNVTIIYVSKLDVKKNQDWAILAIFGPLLWPKLQLLGIEEGKISTVSTSWQNQRIRITLG